MKKIVYSLSIVTFAFSMAIVIQSAEILSWKNVIQEPKQARLVMTSTAHGVTIKMVTYHDGEKMRMERPSSLSAADPKGSADKGLGEDAQTQMREESMKKMQMITILRLDKKENYTLFPYRKIYIVEPLTNMEQMTKQAFEDNDAIMQLLGSETINGQICSKYKATSKMGEAIYWVDVATKLPVRLESAALDVTADYEYQTGPQPADLFEIPADYKKVDGKLLDVLKEINK